MREFARIARRTDDVIVRVIDDETVVHDSTSGRITHLDGVTASVWFACDGRRDVAGVAKAAGVSLDAAAAALARLDDSGLVSADGMSRRTLLARAGAVAWTVPLVSIAAPNAAHAASPPCQPPDLSATTVSLLSGKHSFTQTVSVSRLPTSCSCGTGAPKIEGYWQPPNTTSRPWVLLAGSGTGSPSATASETFVISKFVDVTVTFTLRVTCPGADPQEGPPLWTCRRVASVGSRDGNSSNVDWRSTSVVAPDPCSVSSPTYP